MFVYADMVIKNYILVFLNGVCQIFTTVSNVEWLFMALIYCRFSGIMYYSELI